MAERRMFAKTIIDSDAFLDMPVTSQNLYFHLSMRADDDGFLNNPKKILRMVNASNDDLKILLGKHFILGFESGVIVIKHWRIHNYIQKDRYKETVYRDEKSKISVKENGVYTLDTKRIQGVTKPEPEDSFSNDDQNDQENYQNQQSYTEQEDTECIQSGHKMDSQVRLGKVSIGKVREENSPTPLPKNIFDTTDPESITEADFSPLPYFHPCLHAELWNSLCKPKFTRTKLNISGADLEACRKGTEGRTFEEIQDAMRNYAPVQGDAENYQAPFPYQNLLNFLAKGVENYSSLEPFRNRRKDSNPEMTPERAAEIVRSLQ